jgi:hypothetical protein
MLEVEVLQIEVRENGFEWVFEIVVISDATVTARMGAFGVAVNISLCRVIIISIIRLILLMFSVNSMVST